MIDVNLFRVVLVVLAFECQLAAYAVTRTPWPQEFPGGRPGFKFQVAKQFDGQSFLHASKAQSDNEPFVEFRWASGSFIREYPELLDSLEYTQVQQKPAVTALVRTLPLTVQLMGSTLAAASPVSARVDSHAANGVVRVHVAEGTYGPVMRGETLSKIAEKLKPPKVTLEQTLVGLYRKNEDAFAGKNMNRLKIGQILKVPQPKELAQIKPESAKKEIQIHAADWNAYFRHLELAKKSEGADRVDRKKAGVRTTKQFLKTQLHALQKKLAARDRRLKYANSRIADLEREVADLQRLRLKRENASVPGNVWLWDSGSEERFGLQKPPVVYNADLTPQLRRNAATPNRVVLKVGERTTLRFGIGPRWKQSILPKVTPDRAILESSENVRLSVVLACEFCEPQAETLKRMTFHPSEGRSDEIRFQFTPQKRQDAMSYIEKLQLSIISGQTGREYDRLVIPVAVATDGASVPSGASSTAVFLPSTGVDLTDWRPDVLMYAIEEMGRNVTISIEPISAEMKNLLGPLALDGRGIPKDFRSGVDDAQLIDAMTNSAYGAMSAISLQGEFLKKLSATGIDAFVSEKSQNSLQLSEAEAANVAAVIAQTGQRLYRHLFYSSADTDLRELVLRLEAAAADAPKDKPLRMLVITNRLSLPWQYLHPVGPEVDATKFWGMQFSLSVLRVNNNAREKSVATRTSPVRKIVFARYGSSKDPTVDLAKKQANQLLSLPLSEGDLLQVDTGADLLRMLSEQRKQIDGIVTFLHASAGSADTLPSLQFNEGDVVTSDSLENLRDKIPGKEQDLRYFARGPLVILNACETGPGRHLPHVKLENAIFQLGARGVVVTEVSVWISLGHEVATQLLARLTKGEPVSDALTAVRRELRVQKNNPLGLLYAYYGDPAATFRPDN